MDEVNLFTALRPEPPADAEQIRLRVGRRLDAKLASGGMPAGARAPRGGRRVALMATTAVVAATGLAVALPAVLPGAGGRLAVPAWAIVRGREGTVKVKLSKAFQGQRGLQRALRADGVPAYVRS